MRQEERTPVIVGVGEVRDRPADPAEGREPLALMAEALRRAEADAGAALLARVDALDVIHEVSWPYPDLPALLSETLGIAPRHRHYGPVGGETPLAFLHQAAERIARGESEVAAVCGGEAQYTVAQAEKRGIALPWTPRDPAAKPRTREYLAELQRRHGLDMPIRVYPLYENATQAAWGQTPAEGQAESARLWAAYAAVAARNPNSWLQRPFTPEEIATPSPGNRMIAWPYPKLMTANPLVNQGSAVLVTSLAAARAAGIPARRCVPVRGGGAANEPKDTMQRPRFTDAPAMQVVLELAAEMAGGDAARFAQREFYSCFPCVPKMARRVLGLTEDATPTVAGGLTFHGAPLNAYMLHAACAMVPALREAPGALGLLYGQGGFVTQHRTLVLGGEPDGALVSRDLQAEADRRRGPAPPLVEGREGEATVETHTVVFRADGTPDFGTVVLRLPDGARSMARVPREDAATLGALMAQERSAVGLTGRLRQGREGLQEWAI
ncbi:acetyl-CoA acetyltransferase [Crenalkalicoccus roseus]|uniref:acetyl-CoA acetyltransferase n=1 Tax=Crenalkalicoccus roseus TaxID=1485588 RepID=UPI001081C3A9|nr:acetyl-CoA acetyltransferase [Crenalkalicoccus roseus]